MGQGAETAAAATAQPTAGKVAGETELATAFDQSFDAFLRSETPEAPTPEAESDLSQSNLNRSPEPSGEREAGSGDPGAGSEDADAEAMAKEEAEAVNADKESEAESEEPEWFQKRIGKEVRKRKEAEEAHAAELAKLRAELDELKAAKEASGKDERGANKEAASGSDDPVANDASVREATAELTQHEGTEAQATTLLRRLRTDPEGVVQSLKAAGLNVPDDEDGVRDYLETVRSNAMKAAARSAARVELATERAKAGVEQTRQQFETLAKETFPWLSDPRSEEYQQLQAALKTRPHWQKDPAGLFSAAAAVEKFRAVMAGKSKAAPVKAAVKTPPKAPQVGTAQPPTVSKAKAPDHLGRLQEAASVNDSEKIDQALDNYFKQG